MSKEVSSYSIALFPIVLYFDQEYLEYTSPSTILEAIQKK
jgi:hypothetical protein